MVENPNAHVMYSALVPSKISYELVKIIKLSCTFSVILWIQSKQIFVFNYKKHKWNIGGIKTGREIQLNCHFVHHKSPMNYPGIKLGPRQWEASNFCQVTRYIVRGFFFVIFINIPRCILKEFVEMGCATYLPNPYLFTIHNDNISVI